MNNSNSIHIWLHVFCSAIIIQKLRFLCWCYILTQYACYDYGLLGCDTIYSGKWVQTFQKNIAFSIIMVEVPSFHKLHRHCAEAVCHFLLNWKFYGLLSRNLWSENMSKWPRGEVGVQGSSDSMLNWREFNIRSWVLIWHWRSTCQSLLQSSY